MREPWKMSDDEENAAVSQLYVKFPEQGPDDWTVADAIEAAVHCGIVTPCVMSLGGEHDPKDSRGAIPDFYGPDNPEEDVERVAQAIASEDKSFANHQMATNDYRYWHIAAARAAIAAMRGTDA